MQIEVTGVMESRSGTSTKGKPYTMREQEAYVHTAGAKYPQKAKIAVPDEVKDGYALGKYEVDWDKTIRVGDFGRIEIGFNFFLGKKVA